MKGALFEEHPGHNLGETYTNNVKDSQSTVNVTCDALTSV